MAVIEQALEEILKVDGTTGPLFSNGDSPETFRIFYQFLPQNPKPVFPSVVYSLENTSRSQNADNVDGVVFSRYMFECYGVTALEAIEVDNAVRAALDFFDGTVLGVVIQNISSEDETGEYTPVSKRNSKEHDFMVVYEE